MSSRFSFAFFHRLFAGHPVQGGVARLLAAITDGAVFFLAALLPSWFLPFTIDPLEINKQTLLIVFVLVGLLAWVGHGLLARSFSLTRGWLHLAVLFFLGGYGVIALFSRSRYLSFVGGAGQLPWAFATLAALGVLYFLIVNRFRERARIQCLLQWFLLGSLVTGVYGLLQLFGVHLFGGVFGAVAFNTIGTPHALVSFLMLPTILATGLLVFSGWGESTTTSSRSSFSLFWHAVLWATWLVGLVAAVALDHWVLWTVLLFGAVTVVALPFVFRRRLSRPMMLLVPAALATVSFLFLFIPSPFPAAIPAEVAPSFSATWGIAQQVLRDMPLFGSGPGTWAFDYAQYRPLDVYASPFWNARFDHGFSAILTLLPMIGVVGVMVFAVLLFSLFAQSGLSLSRMRADDAWPLFGAIFSGWLLLVFLSFFGPYTVSHQFAFWVLLGLLGAQASREGWLWDRAHSSGLVPALSVAFLFLLLLSTAFLWLVGQRYVADLHYAQGIRAFYAQAPLDQSLNSFSRAASLNPFLDVYPRDLSQLALAAVQEALSDSEDATAAQRAQSFVTVATSRALQAVQIEPRNAQNWVNAGEVYQSLLQVLPDADLEAARYYQEALLREPHHPALMVRLGNLALFRADAMAQGSSQLSDEAQQDMQALLQSAESWLTQAASVKPDYMPAHFSLALVYDRTGRLDEGLALLEGVLQVVPEDVNGRWVLAGLYEKAQRYDEAIQHMQLIADARPEDTMVQERLQQLNDQKNGILPSDGGDALVDPAPSP